LFLRVGLLFSSIQIAIMRYVAFLLLSINLFIVGHSQEHKIDSLKNLLNGKRDTMQFWYRAEIANQFRQINQKDSCLLYLQKALDLADQIKFTNGEMFARQQQAEILFRRGDYSQALKISLDYLKQAEELKDTLNIFWSMRSVMMTYEYLSVEGDKIIKYAEAIRNLVHSGFFKDPKQVAFFELIGYVNHAIDYYQSIGKRDSVLYFNQRSYELATGLNDDELIAMAAGNLADMHMEIGNNDLALSYYRIAIEAARHCERFDLLANFEISTALIFQGRKQSDSVRFYARKSAIDLERVTDPYYRMAAYSSFSKYYQHDNKFDSAYKYLRLGVDIKDSLYTSQKASAVQNLKNAEELRQQEIEQKKIQDAEERNLNLQYAAIALGLIVFIILFLILSHSIIANQNLIRFFGIIGLLVLFEFINLFIHPYLGNITNHSPLMMLLIMVIIAALLVPAHHYLQKWISNKLVEKNKKIRLAAAKKTIAKLENPGNELGS
jgi:hypothetical protein